MKLIKAKTLKLRSDIRIKPHRNVKSKIIYVRMEDENVEKIDNLMTRLAVSTRSQMIRDLVVAALKNVRV